MMRQVFSRSTTTTTTSAANTVSSTRTVWLLDMLQQASRLQTAATAALSSIRTNIGSNSSSTSSPHQKRHTSSSNSTVDSMICQHCQFSNNNSNHNSSGRPYSQLNSSHKRNHHHHHQYQHHRQRPSPTKRHMSAAAAIAAHHLPPTSTESDDVTSMASFLSFKSAERHPLDKIFKPETVAVIGASEKEGSVGRTLLWNLMSSPFGGTIYPVNPRRHNVMGIRAYANVKSIPEKVDLAVICIPAPQVPQAIQECVDAGIEGAVVISAGFSEAGEEGKRWAQEMVDIARKGRMRIIGPNCLGVMSPSIGFNCTFAPTIAQPGKVAVVSQSGALATAILDWSLQENVGFSSFISIGSMVDVQWADLIDYLGRDPQCQSIILYMESIGDARRFMSAARKVALTKPIVLIKVGRTEAGGRAAASHTGSMTGADDVLDAAFKRSGVLRVESMSELFNIAGVLAKQPLPKGNRLSIITNAGGPAALSTDALVRGGGELSDISESTLEKLNDYLPKHWSHGNPIDVLGDAPPERYAKTLEIAASDENSDGMLVILTPQAMSDPTKTAEVLLNYTTRIVDKPVLASWMGGPIVEGGRRLLTQAGIPTFTFPDVACDVFNYMTQYSRDLESLYTMPTADDLQYMEVPDENRDAAKQLIDQVRQSGRTLLTEHESKKLLELYLIPTTRIDVCSTAEEAISAAKGIGYPVVVKLHSETITHKMDVGGVRLNVRSDQEVQQCFEEIRANVPAEGFLGVTVQPMVKLSDSYEVIFGSNTDSQCGPVLLFGMGGTYVELMKDTVLGLPPLNSTLARQMIDSTKISKALKGFRGKPPCNMKLLKELLVRFSQLVTDLNTYIKEVDINPLVVSATEIVALDARVVVYPEDFPLDQIPKPAIRSYPYQYTSSIESDAEAIRVRLVKLDDRRKMLDFFASLSESTVEQYSKEEALAKYMDAFHRELNTARDIFGKEFGQSLNLTKKLHIFHKSKEIMDTMTRMCMGDYDQEMVLVTETHAEEDNGGNGGGDVLGISSYTVSPFDPSKAYISVIISPKYYGRGFGKFNVMKLIQIAKAEGLKVLQADIASDNTRMYSLCEGLGFKMFKQENGNWVALYKL